MVAGPQPIKPAGEIVGREPAFGGAGDIERQATAVHQQQPVAERGGLLEGVRHHQRREILFPDQAGRGLHHPVGCGGIERRGVFVEEEQFGTVPGCHHQRDDLPLPPGERADRLVEPVLQPRGNRSQSLCCLGAQGGAGGPAEPSRPAAAGRHGEILQH